MRNNIRNTTDTRMAAAQLIEDYKAEANHALAKAQKIANDHNLYFDVTLGTTTVRWNYPVKATVLTKERAAQMLTSGYNIGASIRHKIARVFQDEQNVTYDQTEYPDGTTSARIGGWSRVR